MLWTQGEFVISDDKSLLDHEVIHRFISAQSYWGRGRTRAAMDEALRNSILCFGLYRDGTDGRKQIGFARVIGDNVVCGFIADVFVLEPWRGRGLGKWLIRTVIRHPRVSGLRKLMLYTDTPDFYRDAQFVVYDQATASKFMERHPELCDP